jgi:RNA polymerase sigma-70 factor (ECF subfamily)
MAEQCFQFTWRSLRRLGVPEAAVDDAAQRVFEVATRKLASIRPGAERAFLFNTAVRVASSMRRHTATRRETSDEALEEHVDPAPRPDDATERKRQREQLDALLDALPMELRTVFVLFELEGLSSVEIGVLLDIPTGTAASRLRRAREHFQAEVKRLHAKHSFREPHDE